MHENTSNTSKETAAPSPLLRPKIGDHKMVSYKMPLPMLEKIDRIATRRGINKSMVVRCAIESINEAGDQ